MAGDPELDNLLSGIVTTDDCMACRQCCTFHEDDKIDAPLFTTAQRNQVEASSYGTGVTFLPHDELWQVELSAQTDGSYICPLLDQATHQCNARDVDCFDCRSWPFYVARREGGRIVLAISSDCPAATPRLEQPVVQKQITQRVLPYMVNHVSQNPGLIAEFREGMAELYDVSDTASVSFS